MQDKAEIVHEEDVGEALSYDLAYDVVPLNERRGALGMGLLWLATQTSLGGMFIGFSAQQSGQPFLDLLYGCGIGTIGLCIYGVLAGYLGAVTGQMQPFLARAVFGKLGSILVSMFLIIMGSGWYSFQAVYTGQLLQGIVPWLTVSAILLGVLFTVLMAVNNIIGFKGIGAFGRFVAPVILFVAVYALVSTFMTTPSGVIWATPKMADTTSIMATATMVIGAGAYGNEPDVWRFSRPDFMRVALPMIVSYIIGLFLFPVAGWLMGLSSAASSPSEQAQLIMHCLFGSAPLAAIIILISQFALNDMNLYESINAMTNVFNMKRYYSIAVLVVGGCLLSAWMATAASVDVFFIVAGIGASTVPTATTIMAIDVLILPRLFGVRRDLSGVVAWKSLKTTNWVAIAALLFGVMVSILLSIPGNVIPNVGLSLGLAPFEGWVAAVMFYLVGIGVVVRREHLREMVGLSPVVAG
ncbi:cytosine permease [Acidocella sp.]|uniref:cytosine permease n=1 Tax=Acidocella sp. TaxID=50710 RepID=UPI003CFBED03